MYRLLCLDRTDIAIAWLAMPGVLLINAVVALRLAASGCVHYGRCRLSGLPTGS
jgi:hypothetical protein